MSPSPGERRVAIGPGSVSAQRGLGALLVVTGLAPAASALGRPTGFGRGATLGFGFTWALAGAALLWSGWFTARHRTDPPGTWQARQDRVRPRLRRGCAVGGGCLLAGATLAAAAGAPFASGLLLGAALPPVAIAVLMATGGITPIRYD